MKTIIEEINTKDLICLDEIIQLVSRQFNTTATNYLGEKIKLIFNLTNLNPYISEDIDEMSLVNLKDEILCLNQEIYSSGKVEFVLKKDSIVELKGFIPIDEQKENPTRYLFDYLDNKQFSLGNMYDEGQGVPQDYEEKLKWYRLSAEQGDAEAQFDLGTMYYQGQGVPQDDKEAFKWYRLASDKGDADAQCSLGEMYYEGQGVSQDYAEAIKLWKLAAEQGNAGAQHHLDNDA